MRCRQRFTQTTPADAGGAVARFALGVTESDDEPRGVRRMVV